MYEEGCRLATSGQHRQGRATSCAVRVCHQWVSTWNTPHLASNAGLLGDLRATDLHER